MAPGGVLSTLQGAFGDATKKFNCRCQLMICIIDKEPKSLYQEIKRITLTEAGVLSQVMQIRNVDRQVKDQYAANVAMKVKNIPRNNHFRLIANLVARQIMLTHYRYLIDQLCS